ncbi:MAG: hypothetical protein OXB88_09030 [Bacteriovoracales bacterium]|nr:hypothetical protein [Bacteriovoracales bacterium]
MVANYTHTQSPNLRAYPKTTFVMKASEIVPGKDEGKKCLKACLWHVEGIFCLKTKPGTIAAGCNRRWFWDRL